MGASARSPVHCRCHGRLYAFRATRQRPPDTTNPGREDQRHERAVERDELFTQTRNSCLARTGAIPAATRCRCSIGWNNARCSNLIVSAHAIIVC
jgi:hypothetical protein